MSRSATLGPQAARDALPLGSRIVPSPRVTAAVARDGRTVLVSMGTGLTVTLDDFGGRAWALLADEPTLPLLVERLGGDGTRADLLAQDVARLLLRWHETGIVGWR
jgi:hypothetical protein